jgi:hypothetical protein
MNNIKMFFSIKDLENLSGIKHTPYAFGRKGIMCCSPCAQTPISDCMILASLQKLLNITLLHDYGYKISKISSYPEEQIPVMVREIISSKSAKNMPLPLSRWR